MVAPASYVTLQGGCFETARVSRKTPNRSDETRAKLKGDQAMTALDIEQAPSLLAYLRTAGHIRPDEQPTVQVLAGGVSNRTVLVTRPSGEAWVMKQALTKLRVPVDWFSAPERVHREALGLRALGHLLPAAALPRFVFEDHTHHLLAMSAVPQPHVNWKTLLLTGAVDPAHVQQFGETLAQMHLHSTHHAATLAPQFADRTFFESLRLEPYYAYTATQVPAAAPFLQHLIEATRQRTVALVHGDYSPKNTLLYQDQLVLLDYEVIHWGDPAFDLGFALTHLLSKAHHLPPHRAAFAAAAHQFWATYWGVLADVAWRATVEAAAVRHTLACLLARARGRSPLEYLTPDERAAQANHSVALMQAPPATVNRLIEEWVQGLS